MNKNSNYSEILRHENEITKLKIQAEFGLELNGDGEINPAIENIWLNQILEYERAMIDNKKTTVGELIGSPTYIPISEITEENISGELQSVMELLHKKNIVIDSQYEVDDREMYRFITEELFRHETNSCFPKNMILGFIYEEFHPNDEADIKRYSTEFVNSLADKSEIYYETFISKSDDKIKEIQLQNLKRRLILFRDAFDKIRVEEFTINTLVINDKNAEVAFDFKMAVLPTESKTFHRLSGSGKFNLVNEYDCWSIEAIEMKGVV
jgi:hypothetical protein